MSRNGRWGSGSVSGKRVFRYLSGETSHNHTSGELKRHSPVPAFIRTQAITSGLPTTHEVTWRSIVSAMAICRQALPAQLEYAPVTRERWAQIGITVQFLIVVRTLGEFLRLRHVLGTNFSAAVAAPYVGGALIAACFCWTGVTLYFFRRYTLSVWIALGAVVILLAYKIAVIGW